MCVTATIIYSSVRFISFHLTKTHLQGGNYYADKLLVSNCLPAAVIVTLNILLKDIKVIELNTLIRTTS